MKVDNVSCTDRERMAWTTWRVRSGLCRDGSMVNCLLKIAGWMMRAAEMSLEALKTDEAMFIWELISRSGEDCLPQKRCELHVEWAAGELEAWGSWAALTLTLIRAP